MRKNKNKVNEKVLIIGLVLLIVIALVLLFMHSTTIGAAREILGISKSSDNVTNQVNSLESEEEIDSTNNVNPKEVTSFTPKLTEQEIQEKINELKDELYFENNNEIEITYDFTKPELTKVTYDKDTYDSISLSGLPEFGAPGEPTLPIKPIEILLPYKTDIDKLEIILGNKVELSGTYNLVPGQEAIPILPSEELEKMGYSLGSTKPNQAIYKSKDIYPLEINTTPIKQTKKGYNFATFNLYPIEYIPSSGKISYYDTITIKLSLKENQDIPKTYRGLSEDKEEIKNLKMEFSNKALKDNINITREDYDKVQERDIKEKNLDALDTYQINNQIINEPFKYIIITKAEFVSAFQPLIDWKKKDQTIQLLQRL